MNSILNGARILVTRPAAQADHLCELIAQNGGLAVRFPALEIVAAEPDTKSLQDAKDSDWLIFTSANAVDFAIRAFGGKMPDSHKTQVAAVGQSTANALRQAGWRVDCVPETEFSSEGLLAEERLQKVAGKSCTIVRGVGGREKLANGLRGRGAVVAYLEVYSRRRPQFDDTELKACLANQQLAAVTITSVEALENLQAMLDEATCALLRVLPLVVVSDRIGQEARRFGFKRIAVSRQSTDAAILETLTTLLNGENSGRSN